jgi:hypothetical protein
VTTLSPSCADCLEIFGASTSWNPKGLSRPALPFQLKAGELVMFSEFDTASTYVPIIIIIIIIVVVIIVIIIIIIIL